MAEVLQPGQQIRPVISVPEATSLVEKIYGVQVDNIKELDAYDDKNYHIIVKSQPSNESLKSVWPHGYVFKILNSMDSKKVSYVDAQNQMMLHLTKNGIRCTQPLPNKGGDLFSIEEINGSRHIIRLLQFEPGQILYNVPVNPELCSQTGIFLAQINTALEDFQHPAYDDHSTIWALDSVPKLTNFLFAVTDEGQKNLAGLVIAAFVERVVPLIGQLPKGMIHGDFNEHNILVRQFSEQWVSDGVLDFGDTQVNCYLFEVALAACYMMLMAKEKLTPLQAGTLVVAGYHKLRPLSSKELCLMRVCICARLCQSLVLGLYSHSQDPSNTYVLQTAQSGSGWTILENTWKLSDEEFSKALLQAIDNLKK
ncbi:hydroxylysine kinase [Neocloeon triangulifer]|uniref:hydroxylysine kinase n=1 Tax=Neocloeon triangulifer TaxID=2078957 RepID=UPI00286F83F7|nr:hydroxylysine kinase [Neocloeon triangulifer]XP_059474987.1 hydroxylysine kinase [Neocloeon triangulifer]XP_059474988.1 hydroxylysine kinase [Neocloeon triangulifer]